ncbi:hypothetical protein GSS88_02380 [Corynebacterium sp. 3HC-13]|uniref:hypothetical protein n=1 Tax=Corynebacterium poyangense TaxID=2684405 RepID=UPI001CCB7C23|nr:hypothetical protein [Corynebacterium poyangense]
MNRRTLITTCLSALILGIGMGVGGWMRRWIADDGLIVLRTVLNLQAGNGPVFNAGERVEANTSTLWQYLIWAAASISGARLELVALWSALLLSAVAMAIGALGTGHLYRRHNFLLAPLGGLIYLCLPPARDFATSGLEWGLSIFWVAVLWLLLVLWSDARFSKVWIPLAVWAGLSWLVRPELVLYGGAVVLLLLLTAGTWKRGIAVLGYAVPLPLAYQIFRMGYYGLLTPHTAVAKSASGERWSNGIEYLKNFLNPYWLPVVLVVVLLAVVVPAGARIKKDRTTVAVGLMVLCAALHILYVIRVGGDFMHARMLLIPFFALLLPLWIIPLRRDLGMAALAVVVVWGGITIQRGSVAFHPDAPIKIVDEREFWTRAVDRESGDAPTLAQDYLDSPLLADFGVSLAKAEKNHDALLSLPDGKSWISLPPKPGTHPPLSIYILSLGAPGLEAPLDARMYDTVGLATPLAARQPRIPDGRIGHDKSLALDWQIAASGADISDPKALPPGVNIDQVKAAQKALRTPEFEELFASYQEPMSWSRFFKNIRFALGEGRTLKLSDDPKDYLIEK